ncbi:MULTISPECIES: hypothetical protein [Pectobacterium]|uniref:hypothetical protein n=1 Tax=Pectobacterium TaxID=122277 RepID=UPI000CD0CF04|nr:MULTISPECIES: hypothetical protein [Pectobacterium]MBE5223082.1 hypothetical protein [Pectobacterium quasiaquaticum]POD98558.1 hypothetical protein BVY06_02380 [Pectobacterium odoriferum]
MNNLKNVLDACDIFISGEFVGFRDLDFYPTSGLHALVIKKIHFGCAGNYSIFIPAADWECVQNLNLVSGEEISAPVKIDFNFDYEHPMIWLSDRCEIVRK